MGFESSASRRPSGEPDMPIEHPNEDLYLIGEECRERFLPLLHPGLRELKERGLGLSGRSELRGRYEMRRAAIPHHQLLYTLSGSGWLVLDGEERVLEAGTVFVSPAGTAHRYGLRGEPWDIAWVGLLPGHPFDAALRERRPDVRVSELGPQVAAVLDGLIRDVPESLLAPTPLVRAYETLLLELVTAEVEAARGPHEEPAKRRLRRVFQRVAGELHRPWTVESLARASGLRMSADHFARLCVRHLGEPPLRILTRMRLDHAAELLRSTTHTLAFVAEHVGYASPFALSAAFKRRFGVSPQSFRERSHAPRGEHA